MTEIDKEIIKTETIRHRHKKLRQTDKQTETEGDRQTGR